MNEFERFTRKRKLFEISSQRRVSQENKTSSRHHHYQERKDRDSINRQAHTQATPQVLHLIFNPAYGKVASSKKI